MINKTHNLYVIRVYGKEGSLIKLGYSSNIINRMQQYYHHNPLYELIDTFYRKDAIEFEHLYHSVNKSAIMNEWYLERDLDKMYEALEDADYIENNNNFNKLIISDYKYTKVASFDKSWSVIKMFKDMCTDENGVVEDIDTVLAKLAMREYSDIEQLKEMVIFIQSNPEKFNEVIKCKIINKFNNIKNNELQKKIGSDLKSEITKIFKANRTYEVSEAKARLIAIYSQFGYEKKAKATDLSEYFNTESKLIKEMGVTKRVIILK